MTRAYYNENNLYCAHWLYNLIQANLIAPGDIDTRDIRDVRPSDLAGYTQHHFFAGIGGWSYALRLTGWDDATPVWTGSPPCQDASVAGAVWNVRSGLSGRRTSLVRCWLDLVEADDPGTIYFENVPGLAPWLAEITGRLEGAGYTISRSKRTSASVGAPHFRRRLWIAAHRDGARRQEPRPTGSCPADSDPRRTAPGNVWVASDRRACGVDDGLPGRVANVRAFGNAIDPWAAARFIIETRMLNDPQSPT